MSVFFFSPCDLTYYFLIYKVSTKTGSVFLKPWIPRPCRDAVRSTEAPRSTEVKFHGLCGMFLNSWGKQLHLTTVGSVHFSCSVMSDSLRPHGLQQARPPCPSPTPRVNSTSCSLSWWCHPVISSSIVPFSSCLQSFPASGSFQMSPLFASGGQSIGVSASASVLPMNTHDWFPLGWTDWISLQSKGLWRVFSSTISKHQFFGAHASSH